MQTQLHRKIELDNPASKNQHFVSWKSSSSASKKISETGKAQTQKVRSMEKAQVKKSQSKKSENSRKQQSSSKRKKRPLTLTDHDNTQKQQPAKKARVQKRLEIPGLNVCFVL